MNNITYNKLLNRTLDIYSEKGSLEAYHYITENAHKVQGIQAQIYNFRYGCASASGLEEEALAIMKEAIIEKGYWYEYDCLAEDDDLQPLFKYNEFHQLLERCKEREEKAKNTAAPKIDIIKESPDNDYQKIMIALHGNQENSHLVKAYWEYVLSENYILGLPQSSQIQFSDAYVWDDIKKGSKELQSHYEKMIEASSQPLESVIIGGFSAGARVALNAILKNQITVDGFIFTGPWLPEIEEWAGLLHILKEKGIKGYILCGDQDDDCLECTKKFISLLEEKGIEHRFQLIEGLDHDYPDNFDELLKDALAYITKTL